MADIDNFIPINSQNNDSGGSGDEDEQDFTDADAAIDRMLDELQDFQFELDGSTGSANDKPTPQTEPKSPKSPISPRSPQIPTVSSSLDHLRFSTIAIEDTPDVDLDALLEDLCSMEKDIANYEKTSTTDSGIASNSSLTLSSMNTSYSDSSKASSQSQSTGRPMSPKSPVPANVSSDVRDRLENLQEETRELTPEEQEARFKAEKIKIALEKMKAASVQKLVVKVFDENLQTSKTMLMDQTWTAREVVTKMIKKNDVEVDPNWCLVEKLPELHMERIMEEDETVLPIIFDWTRDTTNMLVFAKRRDKYTLFRNPQNFLLATGTSAGAAQLAEKSKDVLLEEFFTKEHTRLPEVEGVLWLREGKRTWNKHYFILRASGVYYTPKGKTKASRDLICLVKFEHASVYLGAGVKKKYRAPTDHVFCLKHPKVQTGKSKHVYFLCAEDQKTMQSWVIAVRMAKYGYQMYANYLATQQNVEKELMLTSLANRGTASVKFQDEEDEFFEKTGSLRRRQSDTAGFRGSAREGLPQVKTSSTVRVKGQGTSSLGSLFSNAWKKGNEESCTSVFSPTTPPNAAEDMLSPEIPPPTFNISNRSSSTSRSSISSRHSLKKSNYAISEQSESIQLNPAPAGKNGKATANGLFQSFSSEFPITQPLASPKKQPAPTAQPNPPAVIQAPAAPPAPPTPPVPSGFSSFSAPPPPVPSAALPADIPPAPPAPPVRSNALATHTPPAPPCRSTPSAAGIPPAPPPPPMPSGFSTISAPSPPVPSAALPADIPPAPPAPPVRSDALATHAPPAPPCRSTPSAAGVPPAPPPPPILSSFSSDIVPPAPPIASPGELADFPAPPPPLPPPRRSSMSIKSVKS